MSKNSAFSQPNLLAYRCTALKISNSSFWLVYLSWDSVSDWSVSQLACLSFSPWQTLNLWMFSCWSCHRDTACSGCLQPTVTLKPPESTPTLVMLRLHFSKSWHWTILNNLRAQCVCACIYHSLCVNICLFLWMSVPVCVFWSICFYSAFCARISVWDCTCVSWYLCLCLCLCRCVCAFVSACVCGSS